MLSFDHPDSSTILENLLPSTNIDLAVQNTDFRSVSSETPVPEINVFQQAKRIITTSIASEKKRQESLFLAFDDLIGAPVDYENDLKSIPDYSRERAVSAFQYHLRSISFRTSTVSLRTPKQRKEKRRLLFSQDDDESLSIDSDDMDKQLLPASEERELSSIMFCSLRRTLADAAKYWYARRMSIAKREEGDPFPSVSVEASIAKLGFVAGVELFRERREFFSSLYFHYVKKPFDEKAPKEDIKDFIDILNEMALQKLSTEACNAGVKAFCLRFRHNTDFRASSLMKGFIGESEYSQWQAKTEQEKRVYRSPYADHQAFQQSQPCTLLSSQRAEEISVEIGELLTTPPSTSFINQ